MTTVQDESWSPYGEDEEEVAADFHRSSNVRDGSVEERGAGDNSGAPDPYSDMTLHDLLMEGRMELVRDLVRNVAQGMAVPAEKALLHRILEANGYTMGDINSGSDSKENRKPEPRALPQFEDPDYA